MSNPLIATEEGYFVSQKWAHLAEMIEIYNPQLELRWIPPNMREFGDNHPYVVVHRDSNGQEYAVLFASEMDAPEEVMTRIFHNDMKHGDVLQRMEARNTAYRAFEMAAKADELAAQEDMAAWMAAPGQKFNRTFRNRDGELVRLDENLNQHKLRSQH